MYVELDGPKVGAMRREKGLSRRDLAMRAGLAASTVGRVERGEHAVRLGTARKVGKALGVNPKTLA